MSVQREPISEIPPRVRFSSLSAPTVATPTVALDVDRPVDEVRGAPAVTDGTEPTPIFDALMTPELAQAIVDADRMVAEPFEPWGLDEAAPLPLSAMIDQLQRRLDPVALMNAEAAVEAQRTLTKIQERYRHDEERLNRILDDLAEREVNGDDDENRPDGGADVADGPGGPAAVAEPDGDVPDREGSG